MCPSFMRETETPEQIRTEGKRRMPLNRTRTRACDRLVAFLLATSGAGVHLPRLPLLRQSSSGPPPPKTVAVVGSRGRGGVGRSERDGAARTTLGDGVAMHDTARRAAKPAGADLGAPPNTRARAAKVTRSFAGNGEHGHAQEAAPSVSIPVLTPRVLTLSFWRSCLLILTGGPCLLPPPTTDGQAWRGSDSSPPPQTMVSPPLP
jgi:hypothetical protein